jgi:hypothetical protein
MPYYLTTNFNILLTVYQHCAKEGFKKISKCARDYILVRVTSLIVTSSNVAETLQSNFQAWNITDRAMYRAELDALFARLYGLSRNELMYILDPVSVMGDGYPSITFSGLKEKERKEYDEYRTMRLVLEAWDRQERQPELWQ